MKSLRRDLLIGTALPAVFDVASDRAQQSFAGNARNATLEECKTLGREHGEQDAREDYASSARMSVKAIQAHQVQRYLRRIENFRAASLSDEQIKAYTGAAFEAFARVVNQQERSQLGTNNETRSSAAQRAFEVIGDRCYGPSPLDGVLVNGDVEVSQEMGGGPSGGTEKLAVASRTSGERLSTP